MEPLGLWRARVPAAGTALALPRPLAAPVPHCHKRALVARWLLGAGAPSSPKPARGTWCWAGPLPKAVWFVIGLPLVGAAGASRAGCPCLEGRGAGPTRPPG